MIDHIAAYKALLATDPQPPANLSGDGVLYAMFEDNNRADLGILVGLKMLREVGWQGRVQLWHVGHHPAIDAGLDVEIIDAREVQARVGGECRYPWTLKSFAIRYGGLQRVQWLDWDNMDVIDPTPLFAALAARPMLTWHGDWSDRWGFNKEIHQAVIGGPSPLRPIQGGARTLSTAGIRPPGSSWPCNATVTTIARGGIRPTATATKRPGGWASRQPGSRRGKRPATFPGGRAWPGSTNGRASPSASTVATASCGAIASPPGMTICPARPTSANSTNASGATADTTRLAASAIDRPL